MTHINTNTYFLKDALGEYIFDYLDGLNLIKGPIYNILSIGILNDDNIHNLTRYSRTVSKALFYIFETVNYYNISDRVGTGFNNIINNLIKPLLVYLIQQEEILLPHDKSFLNSMQQ